MAKASSTENTPNPENSDANDSASSGKGRPTPTRKEREAANLRPLVSNDRKEAKRTARAQMQVERERARVGMANGEEKYLPIRDRGPQKRFVRDYVDARFNVGELLVPVMFAVIILTFINDPTIQALGLLFLWGFFIIAAIDAVLLGLRLRKLINAKFGESRAERVRWYAAMRSLQLRIMRLPKPQVKRGQFPS
ncbi:DUF3043 domain-containing protein [Salinibacterium sp. NG253]|uniref:DUF3043 domain-containing protein n=1 Tax=unclassified Salinibacterium TaxID=2632331 RepID=UPI0018CCF157|nr:MULTISPECIES: DUF3043 domain-containing protein [unclassified Salinibacterium]MBH0054309.1 DUF3043 domain-containing protein [Salinibacterium sp. SWN139]MBH0115363.1 DUF3043 domain-containing protein [Salinibacterium sp. NG253]MBH0128899.1 DUF3043 domain-containing protein [Salinibacterium sp. NK8237]